MLNSIVFLIVDSIAAVFGGVLLLRFWMQLVKVRPPNPIGQFVFQLSDWLVKPLRRLLPGIGGYDWASLIGALLIATISTALHFLLAPVFSMQLLALASLMRFFTWIFYGFIGLIFIEVILSWVNPHAPMAPFIQALNVPLLRPMRRLVPLIGGIDVSPLIVLLLLQIGLLVVTNLITSLF